MNKKLHVGVVGPCNPSDFRDFLVEKNLLQINSNASSVNTFVKELLMQGHYVSVFSLYEGKEKILEYHSQKLNIYLIPRKIKNGFLSLFFPLYAGITISNIIRAKINEIDLLHAQWTYEYACAAQKFECEKAVFCTVRDWAPFILSQQNRLSSKIFWLIKFLIFNKVIRSEKTHFIANSEYTFDCISDAYPQKKVDIVPNPIQKEYFIDEKKQNYQYTFISICYDVDEPRKNIITLLKSFSLVKMKNIKATLCIVGNVNAYSSVLKTAKKENILNGVSFVGSKTHQEVFEYIDKSYCLVHPSKEETFGNILLEGIARKTLCIGGKNSGAVPQVLGNGKYGLLCDVNNVNSLYLAMEKSLDKNVYDEITTSAYDYVKETYSSDVIVKKTIQVYEKYLSKNN